MTQASRPHTLQHRRGWLRATLAVAAGGVLLSACSSLLGPRTIEISSSELEAKLGRQFPITRRVLNILDLTAAPPTLRLQSAQQRVAIDVALTAKEQIFGDEHTCHVSLSFGLRFEPKDLSIRLTTPRLEQLTVDGLPPVYQRMFSDLGTKLVEDTLQDYPIHQFKPEDLRAVDRMGYEVKDLEVTATGLAIHLAPRP